MYSSPSRRNLIDIEKINNTIFESIKHIDEDGGEYWLARELMVVLNYTQWRRFNETINKAITACENSDIDINRQFANVGKLSINVKGGKRKIVDYKLSRYACYLIAMNGDSRKEVIALAQTYFAVQTRRQELLEKDYDLMPEDLPTPNKSLKELDKYENNKMIE